MTPAIYLGTFTAERTAILGLVPLDAAEGAQIRAVHVLAGERLAPDPQNYWLLQMGRMSGGTFKVIGKEQSLAGGLPGGVESMIAFADPLLLRRSELLACRLSPRGQPAPLAHFCIVPEEGVLSTRRNAHV